MQHCSNCNCDIESDWLYCPMCGLSSKPAILGQKISVDGAVEEHLVPYNHFENSEPVSPVGKYDEINIRKQVFEVIVRQAIAGAPWREIAKGPMSVNKINPDDIEAEVRRRLGGDDYPTSKVPNKPKPSEGSGSVALALSSASQQVTIFRSMIVGLSQNFDVEPEAVMPQIAKIIDVLDALLLEVRRLEQFANSTDSELKLQQDLLRENLRRKQDFRPGDDKGPHPAH